MKKKQTLNEEQIAQANKEAGVVFHPIWQILPKQDPKSKVLVDRSKPIHVQAEKFFDARSFGIGFFGASEVEIERFVGTLDDLGTWIELRWVGNAATANVSLRMQSRTLYAKKPATEWKDVE